MSTSSPLIPGISNDQLQGIMALFQGILRTEMAIFRTEIRTEMGMLRTEMNQLRNEFRQQATQPVTQPVTQSATQPATQPVTQSITQPEHPVEQEEETLQAIAENTAENTAEKPSGNKATIVKDMAQLSTIPRQIITQQAENTTTIWPTISTCLGNITLWYITAMSTQEKDLLRRSQPIGPLQEDIRQYIFGRIETV
ncbi:hypothetical protein HO173_008917 [Letharia columbiana]|uniref:Uncharacterized protein n=1 Tax=Letharia columbiana TaxID=112416 RepID=A0A8H6FQQ3_9LECA|nr:uncharacterized protein HO173_008917 [Letharia columbiana]KAF6232954.1 hypothetical protein HO173_008917 [Letharia columbiana]